MNIHYLIKVSVTVAFVSLSFIFANTNRPNIVFIYADDMGIGDLSHNGGKAPTPHLDRMAEEGIRFTDAHSTSSVCTPSRYSALTGRYNWRTRLPQHVFNNPDYLPLIKPGETTLQSYLKSHGYKTAMIGKWHLGIEWKYLKDFKPDEIRNFKQGWDIDFDQPAIRSPRSTGFDYYWGIAASLDMRPYLFIENEKAIYTKLIPKTKGRKGPMDIDFKPNRVLANFAQKSVEYIHKQRDEKKPFFMYIPLTSPHSPVVPSDTWKGKSGIGSYGDFLMETDWVVGEVLHALESVNKFENTMVIFSADNGSSPQSCGLKNLIRHKHYTNGQLRGHKADIYEGGHRVPFLVTWPKVIKGGSITNRITSQTDILATVAEIIGSPLTDQEGVDSESFLSSLKDPKVQDRKTIVNHSVNGSFSIRQGDWKLVLCSGSGGWSDPKPSEIPEGYPAVQLYNLKDDLSEKVNLQESYPEKVDELSNLLQSFVDRGRSTPGVSQSNDRDINIGPNPKVTRLLK